MDAALAEPPPLRLAGFATGWNSAGGSVSGSCWSSNVWYERSIVESDRLAARGLPPKSCTVWNDAEGPCCPGSSSGAALKDPATGGVGDLGRTATTAAALPPKRPAAGRGLVAGFGGTERCGSADCAVHPAES